MADDPDYRKNRRDSQKRWRDSHPDYWRSYRDAHAEYVERNRVRQRERRAASRPIAKTDAWKRENHIIPGRYQLVPLGPGTVAKTDTINVEIRVVPRC
jgi:hypothetical protein